MKTANKIPRILARLLPLCILLLMLVPATAASASKEREIIKEEGPVTIRAYPYKWTIGTDEILTKGSEGPYVAKLQSRLKTLGYLEGYEAGKLDEKTYAAVKLFQHKEGLTPDGYVGPMTKSALSDASPVTEKERKKALKSLTRLELQGTPYGDCGLLTVPDAKIKVKLFGCETTDPDFTEESQSLTDDANSAAYITGMTDTVIIADHNNQSFATLNYVTAGTAGYLSYADGTSRMIRCIDTGYGINDGTTLRDQYENDWTEFDWEIVMYTCTASETVVFITEWEWAGQEE